MEGFLMASSTQRNTTSGWQELRRSPAQGRNFLALLLLLFCFAVSGCASITLGVVQGGQLVDGAAIAGVGVVRKGAPAQAKHNMSLEPGDEIRTDAQSTAVLTFAEGARVYVQPNTHVRLGSIFVFIGEVLVKARGLFKVKTEYATAASEGTEYLVRVDPEARVRVVVAEDRVALTSNSGRWPKRSLGVGQAAVVIGPDLLEVGQASIGEVEQIRMRIRNLDALVPNTANIGTAALAAGIFAIGVGVMSSRSSNDRDSDRPAPREPPPTHGDNIR
jgi:ferric-dicitrate binding protein FerR (iron transport regulator)